jgi:hypothetical protein
MRKSLQTYRSFFAAYCKKMTIALNIVLLMFTACADATPCGGNVNGTCPIGKRCALTPGSTTVYSCQNKCEGNTRGICQPGRACYLKLAQGGYDTFDEYQCHTCTGTVSNGTCPIGQLCKLTPGSTTNYSCQTPCGRYSGICPTGQACYQTGPQPLYQCLTCTGTVSNGTCPYGQSCKLTPGSTTDYSCQKACLGQTSGFCPTGQACYRSNSVGTPQYNCYTCAGAISNGTCPNGQSCKLTPGSTTNYSCQTA